MPVFVSRSGVAPSPAGSSAIKRRAERMLLALGREQSELSILICDDPTIHALNREHRGKNKPTDVLAFAMLEAARGPAATLLLGDIVVSLDTAGRQAEARGVALLDEVTMLLAHGLLHLLGFDHRTRAEERRMTARTDLLRACAVQRRRMRRT